MPNLTLAEINTPCPPQIVGERARLMVGCYRKNEVADPDAYISAICAVLASYPETVVRKITHPLDGLPGRSQWLPTIAEIKAACDAEVAPVYAKASAEDRIRSTNRYLKESAAEPIENRQRAAKRWFDDVRPSMIPAAKKTETADQAKARLLELSGMSQADFDALPDAKPQSTFERVKP